ncbi:MAG: type II toxin-antitoxin system PemK/MazF family toxin [Candidatus Limnocylindrales bacterium]
MVGIGSVPAVVGPSRGDIHFVDFPDVGGHVIRGPHPGVIVQTDLMRRSSTVVVVPLTSSARAAEFQPEFLVPIGARDSGLPRDGFAKCDQPMTLAAAMLGPRVGRLNPEAIGRVDDALRFVLGL